MIEFELGRARNGKRSRWSKKFPRKRILHRGDEKATFWFRSNWIDDNYIYFKGNLGRFLKSNVGRPVDKVFSEFLSRCDKSVKVYNLRDWFYNKFKEKSEIGWSKGLILVVLFIVFMFILTGCLNLISAPNTIENILGVVILAVNMITTINLIKSQIQK